MDASSGEKATSGGNKKWCGYPRKRVACGLVTLAVIAAAVIITVVVLTRPPDDIETQERNEEDMDEGDLTVLRTATLSGTAAAGTLSLVRATADDTSFLALNDFVVSDEACGAFEIRLDDGLEVVVPLTADIVAGTATDFTEPLDADFDPDLYDQVSGLCAAMAFVCRHMYARQRMQATTRRVCLLRYAVV